MSKSLVFILSGMYHQTGTKPLESTYLIELPRSEKVTRMSSNTLKAEIGDARGCKDG